MNRYPMDSAIGFHNTYPLDSELSGPGFSKLGLDNPGLVRNLNLDLEA